MTKQKLHKKIKIRGVVFDCLAKLLDATNGLTKPGKIELDGFQMTRFLSEACKLADPDDLIARCFGLCLAKKQQHPDKAFAKSGMSIAVDYQSRTIKAIKTEAEA